MKAPKKILVPIDLSVHSLSALEYAQDIAEYFSSEIIVLHVVERDSRGGKASEEEKQLAHGREQEVKKLICQRLIDQNLVARNLEVHVRFGKPAHEIVRCVKELHADLIVMSTHGRAGLSHVLVGSVTEKVVRYSVCPVLTIRPEEFRELIDISEEEIADSLHISMQQ